VAGGVGSAIAGGKFENGAVTAAFGYLFNHCMTAGDCWRQTQEQIGKLATGIGNTFKKVAWALTPGSGAVDCLTQGFTAVGAAVAAVDLLPVGGKAASLTFKSAHYASRLTGAGLDVARVESAVAVDLAKIPTSQIVTGADISGRIVVDNAVVIYRARPMPNGSLNVGTIHAEDLRWMKKMRPLNSAELSALLALANKLPDQERINLLKDLENSHVENLTPDGSRLGFRLQEYDRPPYSGQHAYSCEGRVLDADGDEITVCLYADQNDRLLELELIKWSDEPIQAIQWKTFTVS
jgi:hypothetical protein